MPCEQAKEFLRRHEIPFEAIDVAALDDAQAVLRRLTGGPIGTPTVVIDGEARVGFDAEWMSERLGLKR